MTTDPLDSFLSQVNQGIQNVELLRLILSKPRSKSDDLRKITITLVKLKDGLHLSFLHHHKTNDITKNHTAEEAIALIRQYLEGALLQANLFCTQGEWSLLSNKKGNRKLTHKKANTQEKPPLEHNRQKNRLISLENNLYLRELGVCTEDGTLRKGMQDKYKQINKFVEILESIVRQAELPNDFQVYDMGSGKGYLTFALYDYLANTLGQNPHITGVELRPQLVSFCNILAQQASFEGLDFIAGSIQEATLEKMDMLIALHACDTATDDAILRGIQSQAKVIVCAPCCHKQIRKQIAPTNALKSITKFGIMEERQAELLTDSIRALILEAHGYKTKVFEFIATEHTPKNVLIVGILKKDHTALDQQALEEIQKIKELYNIKEHYLEKALGL